MEDPTTIALNLTFFGTLGLAFVMFVGLFLIFVATLLIAGAGRLAAVLVMALFGRLPREDTVEIVRLTSPVSSSDGGVPSSRPTLPEVEQQHPTGPEPVAGERGVDTSTRGPRTPSLTLPSLTMPALTKASVRKWAEGFSSRFQFSLRDAVERLPLVESVLHSTRPNPAEMSPDWAAAVARADARAKERARAEAAPLGAPVQVAPVQAPVQVAPVRAQQPGSQQQGSPQPGVPQPEAAASVNEVPVPDLQAIQLTRIAPLVESTMLLESNKNAPSGSEPRSFVKPKPRGYEALLDTGSLVSLAARTGKSADLK